VTLQAVAAHIVRRFARLHIITINGEKMPTRKASAIWEKGLQNGKGSFKGESGTISGNYSFGSRFESAAGSNPEELLAAAEAACFSMALALGLEKNGTPADKVETSAGCTIEKAADGFKITTMSLVVNAKVPGIDNTKFQQIAEGTREGCPVSQALKGNVNVTLTATLQ
jgi:osmotically inducible protein OsmC